MDFITNLPKSEGYDAMLVMLDMFRKLAPTVPTVGTINSVRDCKVLSQYMIVSD